MKAHIPAAVRLTHRAKEIIREYDFSIQNQNLRRYMKLSNVALHEKFGFGHDRIADFPGNFAYAASAGKALIGFTMHERQVRFVLPLPKRKEFRLTETGRSRTEKSQYDAWGQACRQRWWALLLIIKAKLEATECGISTFESEFMANSVLPDGSTAGDVMLPQTADAYEKGKMPAMLPMLEG